MGINSGIRCGGRAQSLKREPWSREAEKRLAISAGGDLGLIRREVETGVSALFRGLDGDDDDGFCVLRYEPECREMVLVLGEGRHFKKWLPVIVEYSKKMGAKTMRTHIKRPGLIRWYEKSGWFQSEVVMGLTL